MKGCGDGPRPVAQAQGPGCQVPHELGPLPVVAARGVPRKEVIQPQVPLRLPCYDFTPVAELTVVGCLLLPGWRTAFG
jgi:hypothetical protein